MIHLVTETVGFDVRRDPMGNIQLVVAIDPDGREDIYSIPLSAEAAKGLGKELQDKSVDITIPTDKQVQSILDPEDGNPIG